MATNLIAANHHVTVFDTNPQAFDHFKEQKQAIVAFVPQKAAANSEFVILMLPNGKIVRDVCQSTKKGTFIIDCSTIDVQTSKEMAKLARSKQLDFVDAPVSGGTIGAQKGTLTFMVGSQPNDFKAVEPILVKMGKNIVHVGANGSGLAAKICNNLLAAIRLGLNKDILAKLINSSSGQCWSSQIYNPCPGVVANVPSSNDYNDGFASELMTKDLLLALDAVKQAKASTPLTEKATEIYNQLCSNELHKKDGYRPLYVPLKKVHVDATIRSFAADVTITQVFRNDENVPIEAVYFFPIEEQAAVYEFVAHIKSREIVAQLKEKKEAQNEYNAALQQGHGAYLLNQDEKSQDVFIINVGALPPATECTITIAYVTELDLFQGSIIRFVIPTTIAPRYDSHQGDLKSPASTNSQYIQRSPYTIELHCYIEKISGMNGQFISDVSSSSHTIAVDFTRQDAYMVKFSQENIHLDRDILIDIQLAKKHDNTILVSEPGAVMVTFTPTEEVFQQVRENDQANEFIFVVDCSGSMESDNKIGLTRKAVLLFLKSLPVNSYFNIIRFGSTFEAIFPEITRINNKANVQRAENVISYMQADLGGTELLTALQWLKNHPPRHDRSRQIFLLTDGEISDVSTVLDLCRSMASSTRIFSFGLGASPSRSLVKGLARSTNGRFVFIPPNTNVDIYVNEQLQKALPPSINHVQVKWNLGMPHVHSAPTHLPPVYANDRAIVYGLIDNTTTSFDRNSSVQLFIRDTHHLLGEAKIDQISSMNTDKFIKRLAAKETITSSLQSRFEDEATSTKETTDKKELIMKRIIGLSLKYNILSPYTAFVGVEKRVDANNIDMVLREVPIQISVDDQHLFFRSGAMSSYAIGISNRYSISYDILDNLDRAATKPQNPID
ncbi:unnamed protein product [Rotaria sp. Silwood2]|nr:unnamed protein product [Rotaria sp. Silwood2]